MHQEAAKLQIPNNSWIYKLVAISLVAIGIQNIVSDYILLFPFTKTFSMLHMLQIQLSVLLAVACSIYWSWKEKRGQINSALIHSRLQEIIRFWLALMISGYGFAKIFGMQFSRSYYQGDTVVNDISGMQLTWVYFSQSYALGLIIGLCQVGGSILLLFRRTTLLGTLILLPVMINIVLLNHFMGIPKGAYYNSIVYTGGLLYLLLLRWSEIKVILFKDTSTLPRIKPAFIKSAARIVAIGLPCALCYTFLPEQPVSPLRGKWKVDEFIRNGDTIKDNSWLTDNNVWKNIYIENFDRLILSPNPYVYEFDRAQQATFKFDLAKQQLHVIIQTGWTVSDTMLIKMSNYDEKKMEWKTILRKDTLNLKLSKVSR